jgi:glycosyltransferase involved in cell wall biosynthesis
VDQAGDDPSIEVLLATCNGARYLPAQLDSLLGQSLRDFTVLAADDNSTDETRAILDHYALAHPGFMKILPNAERRLGANGNFGRLLDAAKADYVAFCDQDDVWETDKLERSFALMRETEVAFPHALPVLVHTDLAVVDAALHELGPSFWRFVGIDPARDSFGDLLLGNVATGCTLLANRALYEAARPVPDFALMFDFWLAQVAAGIGKIARLDRATVRYRQHSGNLIGAQRIGSSSFLARVRRTLLSNRTLWVLSSFSVHAQELERRFGAKLTPAHRKQAETLAQMWRLPVYRRFSALRRAGLSKPRFAANLAMFLLLLRNPPTPR